MRTAMRYCRARGGYREDFGVAPTSVLETAALAFTLRLHFHPDSSVTANNGARSCPWRTN